MPQGTAYLLDVQADLLQAMDTRVVVPLLPVGSAPPASGRLNPILTVGEAPHLMMTQALGAIPVRALGPAVLSLDTEADAIRDALDMLLIGF